MYDFIVFVVIAGCVVVQAMRGFGHALYDIAALYVALLLTYNFHEAIAKMIHFSQVPAANNAIAYAIVFGILAAGFLVLTHLLENIASLSLDPFDTVFGGVLGFFSGIIIAHAFVSMLVIHSGGSQTMLPTQIANSVLAKEVYTFQGIKATIIRLRPGGQPMP